MNNRREYEHGSRYALWRWKDIYWNGRLYLRRLILVQCPLGSIMLHWIKSPDKQRHLHDHPVSMLSFILSGGYWELTADRYTHWKRRFNYIDCYKPHKIVAVHPYKETITLCLAGRRKRDWGFYTEGGWIHWKVYHEMYEGSTS